MTEGGAGRLNPDQIELHPEDSESVEAGKGGLEIAHFASVGMSHAGDTSECTVFMNPILN